MTIRALLLLTIFGFILVTVGLFGLYINVSRRIKKLNNTMWKHERDIHINRQRINTIEQRNRDSSNHVYFATDNEINEVRDIKYGGEGI
ncbi:MAG: hypothetical protein IK142_02715 [Clostridiales bacterium]|nr:hypothetical protein [Clostridiales bacterium]